MCRAAEFAVVLLLAALAHIDGLRAIAMILWAVATASGLPCVPDDGAANRFVASEHARLLNKTQDIHRYAATWPEPASSAPSSSSAGIH